MDNNGTSARVSALTKWGWGASVVAGLLLVLLLTPFASPMPSAGLDGSWSFAMNVATAEHLRFGKDIIFTFGPWASVYTNVYHPGIDSLMIGGSLLIAVAMSGGLFAVALPQRRFLLLLFPLVVGLIWLPYGSGWRDATLMLLPLLLPLAVARGIETGRQHIGILCLLAAAISILPLVKGSFSLLAAGSSLVAVLMCWRTSPRLAIAIVVTEVVVMHAAWLIAGQTLMDLPGYFIAQAPIVSGYTNGMSASGDPKLTSLILFLATAVLLVGISAFGNVRRRWYAPILFGLYLFVTFKAGFVRGDQAHAMIASTGLLLLGLLLCIAPGSERGRGIAALAVGALGSVLIVFSYSIPDPAVALANLGDAVKMPAKGLWQRLSDRESLDRSFEHRIAELRAQSPFSSQTGEVDLYSYDLTLVLAAEGLKWKPRPILQSYTAYTPSLIRTNADHLRSNPPAQIYFNADTIDRRYPALEDGASWLDLLGSFRAQRVDSGYAVLGRRAGPATPLQPQPAKEIEVPLGQEIAVPGSQGPVWAKLDIQQTLLGKLHGALYKSPQLVLSVRYDTGEVATFRMIAGMASTGFLLSPTVIDATGFVALSSHYRDDLLGDRKVVAMSVRGESGTRFMWKGSYRATLAPLDIPMTTDADRALTGTWKEGLASEAYTVGGNCNIEEVSGQSVTVEPMALPGRLFKVRGWAAVDAEKGVPNQGASLLAALPGGHTLVLPARNVPRLDVSDHFKKPALAYAGYEAYVDVRKLPSDVHFRVLQSDGDRWLICHPPLLTIHRTDTLPAPPND
ncbi:hypothetical protein [Stenotrophomonas sp. ZAC14D2_NAIMI4_6]|uniref:hypothetical protein n=1 Tax=Stenotrophomonas sp. ZAC14D2_NAIMI4_6 TaxID=2072406 RepID=UPI000D542363|nr:hypothetical protein [Stenotrophomonas sp. ZAC14D2_NAIMI4_6]AWH20237.1 hypothetical protein C1933_02760 [Stenotrophomonas sp. ZAC14D2_NAIMI4_6]